MLALVVVTDVVRIIFVVIVIATLFLF